MVDVVIIGGGPAGLSAAIALAEARVSVVVIEKQSFPIDKPCGEGIMPEGVGHLERLGVKKFLDQNHISPFVGVCLVSQQGYRAHTKFRTGNGLGCRRIALSSALHARVSELKNITLCSETKAMGIKKTKRWMEVITDQGSIKSRLIVGADGLRSSVRDWAGFMLKQEQDNKNLRFGMRRHFAVAPFANHVEVHFRPGLEAYITPCGPKQTNVTLLWNKAHFQKTSIKPSFDGMLSQFRELAQHFSHAQHLSEERATGPLFQRCREPINDGIVLLGDSSGYLDAITGEGISISLAESIALAPVVARALAEQRGPVSRSSLIPYARAHRAIIRPYYRNTSLMLWLARNPVLMNTMIRLGAAKPQTFSLTVEGMRSRSGISPISFMQSLF